MFGGSVELLSDSKPNIAFDIAWEQDDTVWKVSVSSGEKFVDVKCKLLYGSLVFHMK